jgi:heme/copper-type cytochrome/quinol oxidase subunit 1
MGVFQWIVISIVGLVVLGIFGFGVYVIIRSIKDRDYSSDFWLSVGGILFFILIILSILESENIIK